MSITDPNKPAFPGPVASMALTLPRSSTPVSPPPKDPKKARMGDKNLLRKNQAMTRTMHNIGDLPCGGSPGAMNLVCWNCHGAGKAAIVRELRDIAR